MTSRRLILVRHAKSELGPVDRERALSARGRHDAVAAGTTLAEAGLAPDRVVVSPARRARQTWNRARRGLGADAEVVVDERIYDNDVESLLEVIRETPEQVRTLVLVGHNPSCAELASALDDGRGDGDARYRLRAGFPTSAIAVFGADAPWAQVGARSARLERFAVPRS